LILFYHFFTATLLYTHPRDPQHETPLLSLQKPHPQASRRPHDNSSKMRSFSLISLVALLSTASAAPQLGGLLGGLLAPVEPLLGYVGDILNEIPILYAAAPPFLITKDPSPQCANVNGGMFSPLSHSSQY
jgi:hypothetical protein